MGGAGGDTLAALCLHSAPDPRCGHSYRVLLVQTLMTSHKSASDVDETMRSRSTLFRGDASWRELGTLIGVSKSFNDDLFRLSASAMFHDRDTDFEAAGVLDITPVFASPTLLKLGVNKLGRLGVGIATRISNTLMVTLGIHHVHGGETRFGLELAM
ncbi:hypothetical protein DQ04_04231000 [Trypanosoma grayi]|uniref:hypothetical protein n=1 Tax=Trypanosoma grayi TaxID=71804 RepID=UPI0004F46162|nr:hypothetical protein DQ04_04231000 [Trypanosoma grayi]KEG10062.1 hypothetical protein DQ04_04231000 [Trypanosoma grayi]